MLNTTKRLSVIALTALAVATLPACDIENPASVTIDSSDPTLLIRGTRSKFSDAMGMIGSAFVASDEGLAKTSFAYEDESGDISTASAYPTWFSQVHQARILSADATTRADALGQTESGYLARTWHGWTLVRLAELFGDQPFDGGDTIRVAEMLTQAVADFDIAKSATADSTRQRAYAGIARVNWIRGGSPLDQAAMQAAIVAAQKVLTEKPAFLWFENLNFNPLSFAFGRSYGPTAFYRDIPIWFAGFPTLAGHDATLVFNDLTKPQGVVIISATELRMIQAQAHLLLGNLEAAKIAVKAAPLLPSNHVGLCGKPPRGAAITATEITACIDPMTSEQLLVVIQSLNREDQYLSARRSVTDAGGPIMPFKLPRNA